MWTVPFDNITHILYVSIPLWQNLSCMAGFNITYNRFTTLMRISTSASYRSLKYLFYFSIFESFRKDPSASQPTSSSQWMCVTWLPSCSSPSSSVIQLMQHGSGGMANTRRNVKISTLKDGRQLPSICFSILWLWFCLCANWASYRYPWKRKCNWWLCLLLDSCEFFNSTWENDYSCKMLIGRNSVTLVSILRLHSLVEFANTTNLTC